jgi:hypothetical protein
VRDESYSPFENPSLEHPRREAVTVFVMARQRSDQTDSMRGLLRTGPHGWDAVYLLNGELYRTLWCASETLARDHLATHQDALTAAGWTTVAFHP